MKTEFVMLAYIAAMLAANLLVAQFGPVISPINAFFLIGLDLTLRDYLHEKITWQRMAFLVGVTSCLTFLVNPAAQKIAIASAAAFGLAALADWIVYAKLRNAAWVKRSNVSNVAGAAFAAASAAGSTHKPQPHALPRHRAKCAFLNHAAIAMAGT